MSDSLTIHAQNDEGTIPPACRKADDWLRARGVSSDTRNLVGLTIEELVTNCIKHAYDDSREHTIEFVLTVSEQILTILVVDDGRAFDPSSVPQPDLAQAIEKRPIGGLGIHLLREFSDSMSYERSNDKNRLTLTKNLNA